MFYYVELNENMIIAKFENTQMYEESEVIREVSEDIYNLIGLTPCSFEIVEGRIANVEHIPLPPSLPPAPTELELLRQENESLKVTNEQIKILQDMVDGLVLDNLMRS